MIRSLLSVFLLVFLSFTLFAGAGSYSVSGVVADSLTGKGVELATVALRITGDEKIVTALTTDEAGKFAIPNVKAGKYELLVSSVGFNTQIIPVEVNADVKLKTVQLSLNVKTLQAAQIVSEKAEIVKTAEKTVFNVANSPANQTGTAEDVLRNMPGVSVDQKGDVSIIGKQGVKVLVDGRPNAQAENDLPNFLKSIPASSIESIELITNPSAKYDAEGNGGIINIKLKKGRADGLNLTVSAGYGILNHYNGNFDLNYRKKKVNFFVNYSVNYFKTPHQWIENRMITLHDTTSYYNFNSPGTRRVLSNTPKIGLDYFINDKNTLTYTVSGNYMDHRWHSDAQANSLDAEKNLLASYNSTDDEVYLNYSITNDLNWTRKFDSAGQELNIGITHTYLHGSNNAYLNSLGYDSSGALSAANSLMLHNVSSTQIQHFVFQLDYAHPFKKLKGYKYETGVKNETTNNHNIFNANTVINQVDTPNQLLSNNFNYTENIAAAYGIFSGEWKKLLSFSAGLRAEHTYVRSDNTSVNKNYFSLFPSASLTVNISDIQNIGVAYSRRIQRPQFRQINNQISYVDQYTTWQGNAFLQPAFSHIVSLTYMAMPKKYLISLEANGTLQTNGFTETSFVDSMHITRGGAANGSDTKVFNLILFTKMPFTKWFELSMSNTYNYTYYAFKGGLNTGPVAGSMYSFWGDANFKFWKNMVIQVGGWYNSSGVNPQGPARPVGGLHASIKKSFLNDRLTASIAGVNLLQSIKWRWTTQTQSLYTVGSWQEFDRVVTFSLSYRFGSGDQGSARRDKSGDDRLSGGAGR